MSRHPIPRGTARAIRRGNTAPSVNYQPICMCVDCRDDLGEFAPEDTEYFNALDRQRDRENSDEAFQRYRDLREEGYSYHQAMLMSGRGDPDSLGCS
jgi:hypothetical protein